MIDLKLALQAADHRLAQDGWKRERHELVKEDGTRCTLNYNVDCDLHTRTGLTNVLSVSLRFPNKPGERIRVEKDVVTFDADNECLVCGDDEVTTAHWGFDARDAEVEFFTCSDQHALLAEGWRA